MLGIVSSSHRASDELVGLRPLANPSPQLGIAAMPVGFPARIAGLAEAARKGGMHATARHRFRTAEFTHDQRVAPGGPPIEGMINLHHASIIPRRSRPPARP